jgi:hypothetical protein
MTDSLSITRPYPITNMNDNINMDNAIEVSVTDRILPTTTLECLGHQNNSSELLLVLSIVRNQLSFVFNVIHQD